MPRPGLPDPTSVIAKKTVTPFPLQPDLATTTTPFRILVTNEVDPYDPPFSLDEADAGFNLEAAAGDNFKGKSRKAAKISIASASMEPTFEDLTDLIDSLAPDAGMEEHEPPIEKTSDSDRVEEENRNVRVEAFLYAASREDDNDYHLILGRDPDLVEEEGGELYMNVEISGLPPADSPHLSKLRSARKSFKDFFGDNLPGTSYQFYDPPLSVTVEGSLFFDITHATGGKPGPQSLRDNIPTIWEIHPITKMTFHE